MAVIYHYLVKSGSGYLVRFDNNCPFLTTAFIEAFRFESPGAAEMACREMYFLGFSAEVAVLTHATIETNSGRQKRGVTMIDMLADLLAAYLPLTMAAFIVIVILFCLLLSSGK